ncbi:hypothetical protein E3E31_06135 [Thermococcus sp. M39]|uniref:hypothetical protein n=1 Tax=unclassified Thermococcus TaxID=2627626 RepID=UPI00143C61F3|nr:MULTISPECIES: hypothetical protein [unclassified Thermococcus]NJE08102.1 hypothetical protein [Thermococcus sp. M39]NJE11595.1 hypothetical protein [Thermococcus sp. LS2]
MIRLIFLVISKTDIVISKKGMREDLKGWKFHDVIELASQYDEGFKILMELLEDHDPIVRKNALYVIEDMIKNNTIDHEKVKLALDKIIKLTNDSDERVSLEAIETLNLILDKIELDHESYEKATNALMRIVKSGMPILSEYAAEGLGSIGAKIAVIASKIISWLFSLIKSGQKRETQSAAITALTEMAYKTNNKKIVDRIVRGMAEVLDEPDSYIRERALNALERLITRRDMVSKQTLSLTLKKIQPLLRDEKLKEKAELVKERILKVAQIDEERNEVISYKKQLEVDQYTISDIEILLDSGKQEIVAEMSRHNPEVLEKIIELLSSDNYARRIDALWIISRIVPYIGPTKAYSILPILGDFLKSKNRWVRDTAAKTLAEIYAQYPGTSHYILSLLDVLLKSNNNKDIESALLLLKEINDKIVNPKILKGSILLMADLLDRHDVRPTVLGFMAQQAEHLPKLDNETLKTLMEKLKSIYGDEGGRYDEIIASLIDVIDDILKMRQKQKVQG